MTDDVARNDEELRRLALLQMKKRRDLGWHVVAFLVINGMFWALWALTGGGGAYPWPIWITLFWGMGLAFHAWEATRRPITPEAVEREMERLRGK